MTLTTFSRSLLVGIGLTASIQASCAMAQQAPPDLAQPESADPDSGLGDIVVTAQRRAEKAQSVPISVTALSGEALESQGIKRIADVTRQVPNVVVSSPFGEGQQPQMSIRGIGLINFTDSFESPVAMYVDDVYIGSGVGQAAQLFDVERLEVLRGPQGTLFGRNTTGGLFSITTRRPTDKLDLRASLQYASFDDITAEVAGGGPINDNVRVRLAVRYNDLGGWSRGFFDGQKYSSSNSIAVRGSIAADASENVHLLGIVSHSYTEGSTSGFGFTGFLDRATGNPCAIGAIRRGDCVTNLAGGVSGNDLGGFNPRNTYGGGLASFGVKTGQSVESTTATFQATAELGDYTLTSITAYQHLDKKYFEDLFIFSDGLDLKEEQFTQELRLAGNIGRGNFVAGAFYFNDTKDMGYLDPSPAPFGFSSTALQKTESWAVFGQAHYPIIGALRLTAGLRYTAEVKNIHLVANPPLDVRRDLSAERVTGKIGLDLRVNSDTLLFANASSGFKSGGFNGQFVRDAQSLDPVGSEKIYSYELGVKSDLISNILRFNATAFYYDYKDIQLGIFNNNVTLLRNAGAAEIYGIEAEIQARPFKGLDITLGGGALHTRFKDQAIVATAAFFGDIKGNQLPFAPTANVNAIVRYGHDAFGGEAYIQGEGSWRSKQFYSVANDDRTGQPAYGLVNLRLGWTSPGDKLTVEIYSENLTNKKYFAFAGDLLPDAGIYTWGKPRSFGAAIRYKY